MSTIIRLIIAFFSGIITYSYNPNIQVQYAIYTVVFYFFHSAILNGISCFTLMFMLGFLFAKNDDNIPDTDQFKYVKEYYVVSTETKLINRPTTFTGYLYAVKKGKKTLIKITNPIKIKITVNDTDYCNSIKINYGDYFVIRGRLNPIQDNKYKQSNISSGVFLTSLTSRASIRYITNHPPLRVMAFIESIRQRLSNIFFRHIKDEDISGFLCSIVLGDKSRLSKHIKRAYLKTGCAHIFAPSGLHVGIILALILFILRPLRKHKKIGYSVIVVALFAYAAMLGFSPPIFRATFAAVLIMINQNVLINLFLSALILTICNTHNLLSISFQMSYVTVLSILLFYKPIKKILRCKNKYIDWMLSFCTLQVSINILLLPVVMYHSGEMHIHLFVVNLLIVPLLAPCIIWLSVLMICVSWCTTLHIICSQILIFLVNIANGIVVFFSHMPHSSVICNISLQTVVIYYCAIACLYYLTSSYEQQRDKR